MNIQPVKFGQIILGAHAENNPPVRRNLTRQKRDSINGFHRFPGRNFSEDTYLTGAHAILFNRQMANADSVYKDADLRNFIDDTAKNGLDILWKINQRFNIAKTLSQQPSVSPTFRRFRQIKQALTPSFLKNRTKKTASSEPTQNTGVESGWLKRTKDLFTSDELKQIRYSVLLRRSARNASSTKA